MKRYTPHTIPAVTPDTYTEMREEPEGEWVKWNNPLVQAAPELLEALEMLAAVDFGADGSVERGARLARIAIAKATSEVIDGK